MSVVQPYIQEDVFQWMLDDLNINMNAKQKDDLLGRAVGAFEADMSKKYVVPLIDQKFTSYCAASSFARMAALNAVKAKIRQIIGVDKNRNRVIESTEKYIDTHKMEYQDCLKSLLDPMIDFGFALLGQAVDAQTPVQHIGLSRADNETGYSFGLTRGHKTDGWFE